MLGPTLFGAGVVVEPLEPSFVAIALERRQGYAVVLGRVHLRGEREQAGTASSGLRYDATILARLYADYIHYQTLDLPHLSSR